MNGKESLIAEEIAEEIAMLRRTIDRLEALSTSLSTPEGGTQALPSVVPEPDAPRVKRKTGPRHTVVLPTFFADEGPSPRSTEVLPVFDMAPEDPPPMLSRPPSQVDTQPSPDAVLPVGCTLHRGPDDRWVLETQDAAYCLVRGKQALELAIRAADPGFPGTSVPLSALQALLRLDAGRSHE